MDVETTTMGEIIFLYAVVGGICGTVSACIAGSRGRSPGWFWLGFFFGPLGMLLALFLSPTETAQTQAKLDGKTHKMCPFCAEPIRIAAITCRYCGKDIPGAEVQISPDCPGKEADAMRRGASASPTSTEIQREPQGPDVVCICPSCGQRTMCNFYGAIIECPKCTGEVRVPMAGYERGKRDCRL